VVGWVAALFAATQRFEMRNRASARKARDDFARFFVHFSVLL
jgi:hypothetical protein